MNYQLAKELKDAGFKQHGGGDWVLHSFNEDDTGITSANDAYAPTLKELIEACGPMFGILERYAPTSWRAFSANQAIFELARTPEEAVAKLWLALNKRV